MTTPKTRQDIESTLASTGWVKSHADDSYTYYNPPQPDWLYVRLPHTLESAKEVATIAKTIKDINKRLASAKAA